MLRWVASFCITFQILQAHAKVIYINYKIKNYFPYIYTRIVSMLMADISNYYCKETFLIVNYLFVIVLTTLYHIFKRHVSHLCNFISHYFPLDKNYIFPLCSMCPSLLYQQFFNGIYCMH